LSDFTYCIPDASVTPSDAEFTELANPLTLNSLT
jgi:hypothetical protein